MDGQLSRNLLLFHETCYATSMVLVPGDFVGQRIVQSSEQRGLSRIIAQFFGFDGDKFYIQPVQRTEGLTFGQVLRGLPGVGAVGIRKPGKAPVLVPEMDLVMEADDELVLLAEDRSGLPTHISDDVQSLSTGGLWRRRSKALVRERQKIIIVAWSDHIGAALVELDGTVVQDRRCGFTRRCPPTTERSFSKATCAVAPRRI